MLEKINYSLIEGIDEINSQISEKEEEMNIVIGFVRKLNKQEDYDDYKEYVNDYNLLRQANDVYNIIKMQLKSLELLRDKAKEINRKIAVLLACIQSKENDEAYYNLQIESIKEQLEVYNTENEKAKKDDIHNTVKINNFFDNPTVKGYIEATYPNFKSNCAGVKEKNITSRVIENNNKDIKDNRILIISEKKKKVYLPYRYRDLQAYLIKYPKQYKSEQEVIQKEYIHPLDNYVRFPAIERFKEAYSLIRDREAKSFIEALKYALDLMFKANLSPAIIAACSSQAELERYLNCLENNKLNEFKDFEIRFEVNPI